MREDGWQLFGFATPYERQVFRTLLAAKGVGPALALGLLSRSQPSAWCGRSATATSRRCRRVPRVGRKKAERLVLDLADKLDELYAARRIAIAAGRASQHDGAADDAMLGLRARSATPGATRNGPSAACSMAATAAQRPDLIRAALPRSPSADSRLLQWFAVRVCRALLSTFYFLPSAVRRSLLASPSDRWRDRRNRYPLPATIATAIAALY